MKVDVMDIEKFITTNKLQEVYDPNIFDRGYSPTEGGIFSYEIFGRPGSYDRKTVFAYIDLKEKFLHPLVYKNLIRLNRKFEDLINGYKYYVINEEGELLPSEEGIGKTGLDFLYKIWDKISFKTTDSNKRDERIDFFKALKKTEAFTSKFVVMPAFYRDINLSDSGSGVLKHDPINDIYVRLLRLASALEENKTSGIEFMFNSTKANIQNYLVEAYDLLIGLTKKKTGLFRQSVMGKSVDYGSRLVISAINYNKCNSYKDMNVDMTHTGVPLGTCINIFAPFIIKWIQEFFEREFGNLKTYPYLNKKTGIVETKPIAKNIMDIYNHDYIKSKIKLYTKAPSERYELIPVYYDDGTVANIAHKGRYRDVSDINSKASSIGNRPMTWTDLFYMAAVDVCKDKHVYVTRYPLEHYFNIYPSKITVMSTFKTTPQYIDEVYYEHYPHIDLTVDKSEIKSLFIDSLHLYTSYLSAMDGDYDGDQVSVRGVFTKEANAEAERIMNQPSNIFGLNGKNSRPISMECVQTLYDLSKD